MTPRFLLISDLHIRNYARHDEYREYFKLIDEMITKLRPQVIIFGGDLAHSKTNLSPDYFAMAKLFLEHLTISWKHIHVIIIPGNHDCAERNLEKLDAISPVVDFFNPGKYHYLKESTNDLRFFEDSLRKFVIRPFSILDKQNWRFDKKDITDDEILIGLYHGPLKGAKTDLGYIFDHAEDWRKFKELDFLWCGDIHSHYFYDDEKRFCSIGNPIQQDFGEKIEKGLVTYDITDKNTFDVQFHPLPTLYPYFQFHVGQNIEIGKQFETARLKIVSDRPSLETLDYVQNLKKMWPKYKSLVVINKANKFNTEQNKKSSSVLTFNEYIKDKRNFEGLSKLHDAYVTQLNAPDVSSNWFVKKLIWSNLFSYGKDNQIDFEQLRDKSVGIFGANYSGKTSLIDIICFSVFGTWTKQFVKNINFINDNESVAESKVFLVVNNKQYSIVRKLERVKKGKKVDCSNSIEFRCETDDVNLNGDTLPETQANIVELVGTMEDFLLTSISTQFNNFSLIDEKNTKRKQFFSRVLGIDIYEQIAGLVKDDIKNVENDLLKLDFKSDHGKDELQKTINEKVEENGDLSCDLSDSIKNVEDINNIIEFFKKKLNEMVLQKQELQFLQREKEGATSKRNRLMIEIDLLSNSVAGVVEVVGFDKLKEERMKMNPLFEQNEIKTLKKEIITIEQETCLLDNVPCKNSFPDCKFLVSTNTKLKNLDSLKERLTNLIQELIPKQQKFDQICEEIAAKDKQYELYKENEKIIKELNSKRIELELVSSLDFDERIVSIIFDPDEYERLEMQIDEKKKLRQIYDKIGQEKKMQIASNKREIEIYSQLIEKMKSNESKQRHLRGQLDLLREYSEIVGKNGIIMVILKNFVPAISDLMNSIISNFTEFRVEVKIEEEKNLEIYLTDEISTRLIETGSGAQKTIVSYALRLALMNYSQLCSCSLFILDEPGTSLDKEHLARFSKLLEMIKSIDKTILLVTHITELKECVDVQFTVEKTNGFSKIIA